MKHIIPISILALFLIACGNSETPEARQKKIDRLTLTIDKLEKKKQTLVEQSDTVETEKVYPVKVMPLTAKTIDRTIEFNVNLQAWEELYMAPASPGRVKKVRVEIGDRVKKGDLLIEMDETQLSQAKIQLAQLEVDFERMKTLRESNSISAQQYDQVKTQLDVTRSNVEYLKENTKLYAPFNGVITGKYFEDGELYSGAPNTQAGKAAVVVIQQIEVLKALIDVSEKYYPLIEEGNLIDVFTGTYPDQTFPGKIERIYPTIDPLTRTFEIEVKIPNSSRKLRPGMFARTELNLGQSSAIVVPAISLLQQEGTNNRYVFIHKNGVAQRVNVKPGNRFNENIEVISDELNEGDLLIIAGQAVLMDKSKVKISK
ncbi:MAG: efflux RND transporter periplasmic adaptor subunit [Prolixibacteraceae bacterium]|nr:efflux RND transporter periplasmic adaptor subunit [Prolixibacteraceae bacterium]